MGRNLLQIGGSVKSLFQEESNKTYLFSADTFTVPGSIDLEFYSLKSYFKNGGGRI